ncbi:M57 family metalloprotease (plasmid) [Deinococcus sp. KNUC1210]|uniref:M57 family metalloprotease n=1 Tax=Deinococcus sp. KNUC1210 TaxID=2917691 RepID=UPI001EF0DB4D|nr:M57 family metalloprotease [Deinococcus sp. KNUC1210]ULH17612.1 M57 family metalloprotease [Deinococcus sp. KNUC1210]
MNQVVATRRPLRTFLLAGLLLGSVSAQQRVGSTSQPLTISNVTDWRANGNQIPVCWETPGYAREKGIVQAAVTNSWQWYANLQFTGWGACPTGGIGGSATLRQVRIRISPQGTDNAGSGGSARVGMAALSSAADNNPGVNLSFNPDGSADRGRVEYVGVHEFGHVLGFIHEQDTPGNVEGPAHCASSGIEANTTPVTAYDRDSIMNYCNRDGNLTGNLTDIDIQGVQAIYGVRIPNIAANNSCASAPTRQPASLAGVWNNGGQASVAVYPTDRTKFLYWSQWSNRDGGWGDTVRWFAGDFNGDGRTDIGAAWNNGGHNTLTIRLSNGSTFQQVHWLADAGGWADSTVWLPGDYNGDGKTDVAGVWNNGGKVSVAVYLSDGQKFLHWSQWSDRDGGWGDTVRWFAGDFNGDGRTDIGAAWNNNGRTTLTVRQSTGTALTHTHWLTDAGRWSNNSVFASGDFNGDGLSDVAELWNDLGQASIKVSLSNGAQFSSPSAWSTRDGGWIQGGAVKWMVGDFDGDRRSDIGAVWNNGNSNTMTVRRSTGSTFVAAHWATNAGGWSDTTAWCTGAFR